MVSITNVQIDAVHNNYSYLHNSYFNFLFCSCSFVV